MDSSTQTYRLKPDGLQKRVRNNVKRTLLYGGPTAVIVLVVTGFAMIQNGQDPYMTLALIAFCFGFVGFRLFRQKITPEMQAAYDSYQLTLHYYSITRVYLGLPTVTIPIKSIRSITRVPSGQLLINSSDNSDEIYISQDVENYPQLVERLEAIMPFTESTTWPISVWLPTIILLGGSASFIAMLSTKEKWLVTLLVAIVVGAGTYSFFFFRNSPKIPAQFRKTSWFLLGMIGLALYYLFLVFSGDA